MGCKGSQSPKIGLRIGKLCSGDLHNMVENYSNLYRSRGNKKENIWMPVSVFLKQDISSLQNSVQYSHHSFKKYYFMQMSVSPAYMCIHHICVWSIASHDSGKAPRDSSSCWTISHLWSLKHQCRQLQLVSPATSTGLLHMYDYTDGWFQFE